MPAGRKFGEVGAKTSAFYDTPIGKALYLKVKDITLKENPEIWKEYRKEYLRWWQKNRKGQKKKPKTIKFVVKHRCVICKTYEEVKLVGKCRMCKDCREVLVGVEGEEILVE